VRALFANCQSLADAKVAQTWGDQFSNVLQQRSLDLVDATRATCKLQAERTHCTRLADAVATCDIVMGISVRVCAC
jgi:hypothetical protein